MMSCVTSLLRSSLVRSFSVLACVILLIPFSSRAQSADETALRELVERFFSAYQNRDMNSLLALWSDKSPNLAQAKQAFERTFAASKLELRSLALRRVAVEDGRAVIRVVADIGAVDAKTGSPADGFGKINRTLECVKEGNVWKGWRFVPSEEDLAAALVTAKTDQDRRTMIAAEKELVSSDLVAAMLGQVHTLYDKGRNQPALEITELAEDLARQLGDKKQRAAAVRIAGGIYYAKGDYTEALSRYEKSLTIAEELNDKRQISLALGVIGLVHGSRADFSRALEYYQRSLRLSEEIGDKRGVAENLNNIGIIYLRQGEYDQALEYFRQSLERKEAIGDKAGIASTLVNIGSIRCSQDRYGEALDYYRRSLAISEALGNLARIPNVLTSVGNVHLKQKNYAQAMEHYERSLKLLEEMGNKLGVAIALMNMGIVANSQGNYAQALDYYQRSLTFHQETGRKSSVANVLQNIGATYERQGDMGKALEAYEKSVEIREEIGDKRGISRALANIAGLRLKANRYAEGAEIANRSAAIARQTGLIETIMDSRTIAGEAYRRLGKPELAREAFSEAIAAAEELRSEVAGDKQQEQQFFDGEVLGEFTRLCGLRRGG